MIMMTMMTTKPNKECWGRWWYLDNDDDADDHDDNDGDDNNDVDNGNDN